MDFFHNPELAEAANLAVRTVQYHIRQVASSTISSAIESTSSTPLSSATPLSTLDTVSSVVSSVASSASPTGTSINGGTSSNNGNGNSNSGSGSGGQSSPLLFFVALGFGVVFTNLWIIVGVKYCFRYNARNRQMRMTGEDGDPITLENMPQHPRRRRREKKLMTMDEVNEKFPMMKYKSWVASRAREGLPTLGGVSVPPSRANSLREADGIVSELPSKEQESIEDRPATAGTSIKKQITEEQKPEVGDARPTTATKKARDGHATTTATATTGPAEDANHDTDDEHDSDDEQIDAALPPDMMSTAGDACAICIDTLEDDDDIRGLTCGHAFHAVCLDPWLTSRRACCPLCKADYYTPKPRPPAAEAGDGTQIGPTVSIAQDPRTNRMNMPSRPGIAWIGIRGRGRAVMTFPRRGTGSGNERRGVRDNRSRAHPFSRSRRQPPPSPPAANGVTQAQNMQSGSGILSSIRQQLPTFRWPGSNQNNPRPVARPTAEVTPSTLEAGTR